MGWTTASHWRSYKHVMDYVTQPSDYVANGVRIRHTCLAKCRRGSVLWSVWRRTNAAPAAGVFETTHYIACHLIKSFGKEEGFGYKDMDESVHPYYYTCPLKYLDMAPVACQEWRDKVIAHHAINNMALKPGLIVGLRDSVLPAVAVFTPGKSVFVGKSRDGQVFRVPRRFLTGQTFETWPENA